MAKPIPFSQDGTDERRGEGRHRSWAFLSGFVPVAVPSVALMWIGNSAMSVGMFVYGVALLGLAVVTGLIGLLFEWLVHKEKIDAGTPFHPDQIRPWVPASQQPLLRRWAKAWPWILAGLVVLVYVLMAGVGVTWTALGYLGTFLFMAFAGIWWRQGGSKQKGPN